jgi:glutamyl/glutaminyl-tRNA synthetase
MGASNAVRVKSPKSERRQQQQQVEQNQQNLNQAAPRFNMQDIENNNNHIFVNPHERFFAIIDECDLLNNNMALLNNNYFSVTLSPSTTTPTTLTKANVLTTSSSTLFKLNKKSSLNQHTEAAPDEPIQSVFVSNNKSKTNHVATSKAVKMQKESSGKSPKKQQIMKESEKTKKKKKEKPKAPTQRAGGGGGGAGRRGMADQDQLNRRPRRKLNTKEEK